jgi:hypothetical protein
MVQPKAQSVLPPGYKLCPDFPAANFHVELNADSLPSPKSSGCSFAGIVPMTLRTGGLRVPAGRGFVCRVG